MTKCRKNDKNPPLSCVLKGFAHGAGELGGIFAHGVAMKAQKVRKNNIPPKTDMIANSLVGNVKAGHGGFCHMNKIKKMEGPRHGGEGLKRVGKQLV